MPLNPGLHKTFLHKMCCKWKPIKKPCSKWPTLAVRGWFITAYRPVRVGFKISFTHMTHVGELWGWYKMNDEPPKCERSTRAPWVLSLHWWTQVMSNSTIQVLLLLRSLSRCHIPHRYRVTQSLSSLSLSCLSQLRLCRLASSMSWIFPFRVHRRGISHFLTSLCELHDRAHGLLLLCP